MSAPQSATTSPNAAPALLTVRDLSFAYGSRPVLEQISLDVRAGQVLAIVGPNGCGKSTLLKLLCGQLRPRAGTVALQSPSEPRPSASGQPKVVRVANESPVRNLAKLTPLQIAQSIALVPQNTTVGFAYTVRQMVLMGRWPVRAAKLGGWTAGGGGGGFENRHDHEVADTAMWTLDIHSLADRPVTQLSGGERQRVIIARALAQETPILLADEPTSALDIWHQLELLEHLQKLAHTLAKAIVVVTHDLNLALRYADEVLVLDQGKIVAAGPPCTTLTPPTLEPVYHVAIKVGNPHVLTFHRPT
ncbi:MAG: ABC transporter ATP-binding protein [Phycisphaerae bacterium]